MAFPFETKLLTAHLRVAYLALADDTYAKRILKPLNTDGNISIPYFEEQSSPPITFDIARHVQKSINNNERSHNMDTKKRHRRRKSKRRLERTEAPANIETENTRNISDNESAKDILPSSIESNVSIEQLQDSDHFLDETLPTNDAEDDIAKDDALHFRLLHTKTIRGKSKSKKPSLVRFFHSGKDSKEDLISDSDSDSDGSIKTLTYKTNMDQSLDLIEEELNAEDATDDGYATDKRRRDLEPDASDAITIDSDFGVPVNARGQVLNNADLEDILNIEEFDDEDDDDDDDYYSEDEYDEEDLDLSSTDSAFTDIETDSLIDSSLLLHSYDRSNSNSYSFGVHNNEASSFKLESKKSRKKKRSPSYDNQSLSRTVASSTMKHASSQTSIFATTGKHSLATNAKSVTSLNNRKPSLIFEKVNPKTQKESHPSSLTSLIQYKSKSTIVNPLNYYSFADSQLRMQSKKKINIFLPPKNVPTLKNLSIDDNVVIVDCIGFILLNLSKIPDFDLGDFSFSNPNTWRLELVDEDGENYGSFGILDRTRLLSSYNNLLEVALCKVTNEQEVQKNTNQTPLPIEFVQSLEAFRQKRTNIDQILEDVSTDKTSGSEMLKIQIRSMSLNLPYFDTFTIDVSSNSRMGQILKDVCSQKGLQHTKYAFKKGVQENAPNRLEKDSSLMGNIMSTLSPMVENSNKLIDENELVSNLQGHSLELVMKDNRLNMIQENPFLPLNANITPSDSTYTIQYITPDKLQLEDNLKLSVENSTTTENQSTTSTKVPTIRKNTAENIKGQIRSNKYLDDIMTGKNPLLPTNLNTIYFKWKVFRKKTTILNKIEKSLVIDGDYIHLTPSDDIVFKKNPNDNPFAQSEGAQQHHNHHHHHLYYYNYTNYYKELMMKTSSFHITQIIRLKQYKSSKNPNHFKIVIQKNGDTNNSGNGKDATIEKKYDLEAVSTTECQEIIDKLKWVLQVYSMSSLNQ